MQSMLSSAVCFGEAAQGVPARRILLVEDVSDLADAMAQRLHEVAREVSVCGDGRAALESLLRDSPDLVILDIGLPGLNGLEICRALRAAGNSTLVLMLSGRGSELDRVVGLEFGADDYMVKPFSMLELLARVRALFRRIDAKHVATGCDFGIRAAGLVIDVAARKVTRDGHQIELTEKEFDLLHVFAANPGRVFSRARLLDLAWGHGNSVYEYTVTSHINRLRRKIEPDAAHPRIIQTVWGLGYRFNHDAF